MSSATNARPPRVAIVISHPIQHFCPQYTNLAADPRWQIKVFFASAMGREGYYDANFKQEIAWSNLRLDQFPNEFLSEEALPSSPELDAPALYDRLAAFAPDVVVVHGYRQKFQQRARRWAKANGALVYYISDTEIAGLQNVFKRGAKALILRRMFSRIDRFLTVGNSNELFYHSCGVPLSRMTRMHFPIDREAYEAAYVNCEDLRRKTRQELGIADNEIVVSTVGKLVKWKRQCDLIRAAARLSPTHKVKALLIGSGPDNEALRAIASELGSQCSIFAGFVAPDRLPHLYAASDIYAHVADFEPHSLAISEAIYMGLPLVLSDRCGSLGPNDDLRDGRNGLVYRSRNVDRLAQAIERLAEEPRLRRDFGIASRGYAVAAQQRSHGGFMLDALRADGLL